MPNHPPPPSLEEIAARSKLVRDGWSEKETAKRWAGLRRQPWQLPTIVEPEEDEEETGNQDFFRQ